MKYVSLRYPNRAVTLTQQSLVLYCDINYEITLICNLRVFNFPGEGGGGGELDWYASDAKGVT